MIALHAGAIIVAIVSGSYALVALLFASPREFGLALALCGVCWIVAHFIEWTVERERAVDAGPRTAMRRSDRAVEVMARRTPWILRGMARLAPATRRS